jgi:hypothetical protein
VKEINLLLRGSIDGYKSQQFKEKCGDKGATLTLVQSKEMKIFGGFTDLQWSKQSGSKI